MSNGFDKEAEREKLREKLSDDDEKREHTQRMSELLLKGATMTNRHCDDCGDPIFRHDGREFCPSCHTVDAADVQDAEETETGVEAAAPTEPPETPQPPEREAVDGFGAPPTSADPAAAEGSPSPTGGDSPGRPSGTGTVTTDDSAAPSPPRTSPASTAASGGVADARASLTRTLHRFAVAAEETDDPRRARDHLQAAREAAEALAALD